MKNTYLITGATGFVGSNIVRSLVNKGEKVSVITRNKKLNWRLSDISSKIDIYNSDITSPSIGIILDKIRPDYIFHLAAYGVMPDEDNVGKMVEVNIKGTINLINAAKKNKFKLFINSGSSVEYGIKNIKMNEKDHLVPINDYGVTKATVTLFCQKEGLRNNLPIITFRLFTPFGPYEDKTRLIPSVILSSLKNEPIKVSVPTSVRDFVYIDDVTRAYLEVVNKKFNSGEILNIGSGEQHSIKNIVTMTRELTACRSKVYWGAVNQQARFIEPRKWEADIERAYKVLDWKPRYSLEQGLKETIEWFRKNQKLYA